MKKKIDVDKNLKALDEGRLEMSELPFFEFCGETFGKDIFRNIVTGEYLD
jgi:hypothetical protein